MRSHEGPRPTVRLAAAVRARRRALGVTQKEVALLAGCGPDFMYDLEQGKGTVRLDKVLDVLAVLGLELAVRPGKGALVVDASLAGGERKPRR